MEVVARWTGWIATTAILIAALVPVVQRLREGRRAPLGSPGVSAHVMAGFVVAALAFLHTVTVIPALGSSAAIGGGMPALVSAGLAFFLLVAHAGLGLQLRDPKLKARLRKRRMHVTTATLIAITVATHAALLLRARQTSSFAEDQFRSRDPEDFPNTSSQLSR